MKKRRIFGFLKKINPLRLMQGTTKLEIGVSVFVFAVMISGVLFFTLNGYKYYKTGKNITAAEEKLDSVLSEIENAVRKSEKGSVVIDSAPGGLIGTRVHFFTMEGVKKPGEKIRRFYYVKGDTLYRASILWATSAGKDAKIDKVLPDEGEVLVSKIKGFYAFKFSSGKRSMVNIDIIDYEYYNRIIRKKGFISRSRAIALN